MTGLPKSSLPWAELDHGLVDSNGIAIRKCSMDFLTALYTGYMDSISSEDVHVTGSYSHLLYKSVVEEVYRLSLYPTLFPSMQTFTRFYTLLHQGTNHQFDKAKEKDSHTRKEGRLAQANMLVRTEERVLQMLNRPTYEPELLPWEQFLLKGSPGSGVQLPVTPPNTTVQVMPIGGVALHLRWLRNTYLVGRKCRDSVLPEVVHRCPSSLAQGPYSPTSMEPIPSSGLTYRKSWIALTPNIYFDNYGPMLKDSQVTDKLENFNAVIERLEGENLTDYHGEPAGIRAMFYRIVNANAGLDHNSGT